MTNLPDDIVTRLMRELPREALGALPVPPPGVADLLVPAWLKPGFRLPPLQFPVAYPRKVKP